MSVHNLEPTLVEAAALLAAASVIDAETDRGETIELWTISSDGQSVAASGPRLAVAAGMRLECRVAQDHVPLHVWAVIEEAEYRSQARASLAIRVIDVASEGYERRAERRPLTTPAVLRASVCDRIVPGESIAVTIVDLSAHGVGVTTTDTRARPGDRMRIAARFFEGEVNAEVRIAHCRDAGQGQTIIGCSFIDPAAVGDVLSRVLARLGGDARRPRADRPSAPHSGSTTVRRPVAITDTSA